MKIKKPKFFEKHKISFQIYLLKSFFVMNNKFKFYHSQISYSISKLFKFYPFKINKTNKIFSYLK